MDLKEEEVEEEEVEEEEEIGKSSEVKDGDQVFHREKTTHIQTTSIEIDSSLLNHRLIGRFDRRQRFIPIGYQ